MVVKRKNDRSLHNKTRHRQFLVQVQVYTNCSMNDMKNNFLLIYHVMIIHVHRIIFNHKDALGDTKTK